MPDAPDPTNPLDALFWREEILQVLYWMEGEGLATAVPFGRLLSLLDTKADKLLLHLRLIIEAGYVQTEGDELSETSAVRLTPTGKKEAGNIFRNAFEGMQKGGHGECGPDCELCYHEGEKLEDCVHNCADSRHQHHA
ncbi:MAG: hypothetical protein NVS3B25_34250 [Hymenobacter sp.]